MRLLSYISILYVAAAADIESKPIDLENGLFGHEVTDNNKEKIEFHQALATIYDPYPLRRVFQNVLVSMYGQDAQTVYYKLAKEDKLPKLDSQTEADFNKNRDWLADLAKNETRQEYLKNIMNTENVMLISPNRFQLVDSHLGCWIIVNVDSYEMNGLDLIQSLSNSFYEKCSIGVADMSFPPNFRLIEPLVNEGTPSLLLKKSQTKIVKFEFRVGDWISYPMPVETWGRVLDADSVQDLEGNGLVDYIMDYLYSPMTDREKIEAIYSPIHVMDDPNKEFMFNLIQAFYYNQNIDITASIAKDIENGIYQKDSSEMNQAWGAYIEDSFKNDNMAQFLNDQLENAEIEPRSITRLKPLLKL